MNLSGREDFLEVKKELFDELLYEYTRANHAGFKKNIDNSS